MFIPLGSDYINTDQIVAIQKKYFNEKYGGHWTTLVTLNGGITYKFTNLTVEEFVDEYLRSLEE